MNIRTGRPRRGLNRDLSKVLFGTLVITSMVGCTFIIPKLGISDYLKQGNMTPAESKEVMNEGNKESIQSRFMPLDESDMLEGINYESSSVETINIEGVSYEKTLHFRKSGMKIYLDENGSIVQGIAFQIYEMSDEDLDIIKLIFKRCMNNDQQVIDLMLATLDKFKNRKDNVEMGNKSVESYKLGKAPTSITITPEYAINGKYKYGTVQISNNYSIEQPLNAN